MTDPEPAGYVPPPGTPLVTQADRWQWQRRAVRELAAILDAHPDLPAITWTLAPTGGLAGQVNGLGIPPEQARATFTAWQHALCIDSVKETPIRDTGVIALTGRAYRGTVLVGLATRIYGPVPDDEALSQETAAAEVPEAVATVRKTARLARGNREPAASQHGPEPTTRPGQFQAVPLIPTRPPEGPQPTTQTP